MLTVLWVLVGVLGVAAVGLGVVAVLTWRGQAAQTSRHAEDLRGSEAEIREARARADRAEALQAAAAREVELSRQTEDALRAKVVSLSEAVAQLRERAENAEALRQQLEKNEQKLKEAFEALSNKALKGTTDQFLKWAKDRQESHLKEAEASIEERRAAVERLVKPIGETLEATKLKLESIEKSRVESFAALQEKMEGVTIAGRGLRDETSKLTKALSRPEIRGQYGEIQLRRVAELAGMTSYCDFTEQTSERSSDGDLLRPDMVVTLPNDRVIAVDAKTNTYAYLEAVNAETDNEREHHLERFTKHVADQAKKLGDKKYWSLFDGSPEFVVMFVPGDHFIDAALARRPRLLDEAAQRNVILASPSTLIGLLRAVAVGWREHALTEQAGELLRLGRELHERASVVFDHTAKLGRSLDQSIGHYNTLVGSIDSRVTPTLRKFEDAGAKSSKPLAEVKLVEASPRPLTSGD
ncbi:MAG: DNA recombination protein RmuC [Planctomycetota bacterium]